MKAVLIAPLLLTGCAMNVYHDSKSEAEMKAEVRLCTSQAKRDHPWNPEAALRAAEKCLADKGYTKEAPAPAPEASAGPATPAPAKPDPQATPAPAGSVPAPGEPCAVPCRRPK
jgi:hypothetical protein